jgi:hypothetical protein
MGDTDHASGKPIKSLLDMNLLVPEGVWKEKMNKNELR